MGYQKIMPTLQAILAAFLFGLSTPLSKVLLGNIEPVPLAAFLYLGSGIGLLIFQSCNSLIFKHEQREAPLTKKDFPWLLGAIVFGGVLAPIILMISLQKTPASTASLLLNFECVSTTVIAAVVFKEYIGKRMGIAILIVTFASVILSWDLSNKWGISIGALGIIAACICWGIDNNFTRNISQKNPFTIVAIKGIASGLFSLIVSLFIRSSFPDLITIMLSMILGFISYGLSVLLFVYAMRNLGSARTSAFFSIAPFIGAILSFLIFKSVPEINFIVAVPIMAFGIMILIIDNHEHEHLHKIIVHDHKHTHQDGHHNHIYPDISDKNINHSHLHEHEEINHSHSHYPDIHHRH